MSIRSVRNIARNCLNIPGVVSIRNDIMTIRDRPPPRMLREELDFIHQTRCRPEAPTDLRVTEVAEDRIGLAWTDNADNEDGFRIRFQGERDGFQDHEGTRAVQETRS